MRRKREDKRDWVEPGIFRRVGGTYGARVRSGRKYLSKSFPTFEEAKAWRDETIANREPIVCVQPKQVARSVYQRQRGTFEVRIAVNGKQRRKSFSTLQEAIAWRDEQRDDRQPRRRAFAAGINALHRSTWAPKDVLEDIERTRELIQGAPREEREINGRTFTVVRLPDVGHVQTRWDMPSLKQAA